MKRIILSLGLVAVGLGLLGASTTRAQAAATHSKPVSPEQPSRIDPAQLMAALSVIESGDNDKAIGKAGEVSRYQIIPRIWRAYGGGNPRNAAEAKRVATKIMAVRIEQFESKHGRQPTLVEVYALWRSPVRALQLKVSAAVRECGTRFSNLVEDSQES
jgi:hypothetical protein